MLLVYLTTDFYFVSLPVNLEDGFIVVSSHYKSG
jgi:hypothetical protein